MRPILRNSIIVIVALAIAAYAALPPANKLKLGKDLRGGVSLVYSVQIAPNEDAKEVLSKTIDVLRERIDPDGVYEIAMFAQGRDRIEISMPLPGPEAKARRKAYEDELTRLAGLSISSARLEAVLRAPSDERDARIQELSGNDPRRMALLKTALERYDESNAKRAEYQAALAEGKAEAELEALVDAAAAADLAFDAARDAVVRSSLPVDDIRRSFQLSNRKRLLADDTTGQTVALPSPRERAMERLRTEHAEVIEDLNRIESVFNEYNDPRFRKTLDDPQDLVRLLRGAGVLSFRIGVPTNWDPAEVARLRQELKENGPRAVTSREARWYKINDVSTWYSSVQEQKDLSADPASYFAARGYIGAEYDGEFFLLAFDTPQTRLTQADGAWQVAQAYEGRDQLGRPSIDFQMDTRGAVLLGRLTKDHVGDTMAVLLDDQVYTAPRLNDAISRAATVTGDFDDRERQYVIRVLSAGALQAKLSPEPISVSVLGPEFGADNLRLGLRAGFFSFVVCAVFLVVYYFALGGVAVFGLVCNAVLLLGIMGGVQAAFTLPGIAGVILTFAMAVDANVLIYERMREEFGRGVEMKQAVRLGYDRAMSAIVDGNVTNMIHCVVLYFFGTPEIKGFAVTMMIGVCTTLFAQLFITRTLLDVLVIKLGWRRTSMLPIAFPAVQRAFTVNVDWMSLRKVSYVIFGSLSIASVALVMWRGSDMLDTEFLGGTAVTIQTKRDESGAFKTLTRREVIERLEKIGASSPLLSDMSTADILVINPQADGVTSNRFTIKTEITDATAVSEAITRQFDDVLDAKPPLRFTGSTVLDASQSPAFPVLSTNLGEVIGRGDVRTSAKDFLGGVAIFLQNIDPPVPIRDITERLEQTRSKPDFADTLAREHAVFLIDGREDAATSAVVLVRDPEVSYFGGEQIWAQVVRDREWAAVQAGLAETSTFLNVQAVGPAVAERFTAQAIAAMLASASLIIVYVWIRFNSFRYSAAAIIPTLLDCVIATGFIALAGIIAERFPPIASSLGLQPFKIDLTAIAAILTILGYSINDKIVVLDRIRENRGKLPFATREIINTSVNQTMSRTLMTGTTTILSTLILYLYGGEGVRAFAFALGIGVVIGTISSVLLGAPMVWVKPKTAPDERALVPART